MICRVLIPVVAMLLVLTPHVRAQVIPDGPISIQDCQLMTDPVGDAAFRHPYTSSADGGPVVLPLPGTLPDLVSLSICGWDVTDATDRYTGQQVTGHGADFFRLDLVLNGLFNPPDAPDLTFTTTNTFGSRPVYGYVELNMDRDIGTGGQVSSEAKSHYLANVARFACRPRGALAPRAAIFGTDVDADCTTGPMIERSGAEFMLNLCGCDPITIFPAEATANGDMVFDAGETWDVAGRFFKIATGYEMIGPFFGGSASGFYDPIVPLRFSHCIATDRTTITLVYPITASGAEFLSPNDFVGLNFDASDDSFVQEALDGIIFGVDSNAPFQTCGFFEGWRGVTVDAETLNPTRWLATAIVGMGGPGDAICPFRWTDVGFAHVVGDFDADGLRTYADRAMIVRLILDEDGGPLDTDGIVNGRIELGADNFSIFDTNGNGVINDGDQRILLSACDADLDGNRIADVIDLLIFLADWFVSDADFDASGSTDVLDLLAYIDTWFEGCS